MFESNYQITDYSHENIIDVYIFNLKLFSDFLNLRNISHTSYSGEMGFDYARKISCSLLPNYKSICLCYSKIEKHKPNFIHKINYLFITATVDDTLKLIDNFNKFYSFF